jgi:RNA polymerase sigma factor (sigma-70 family)
LSARCGSAGREDPGYDRITGQRVVIRALAQLPVRQRQVVELRYFEDLSVEQTAQILGATTGTVKSYTSRALARLRELLVDEATLTEVHHERRR